MNTLRNLNARFEGQKSTDLCDVYNSLINVNGVKMNYNYDINPVRMSHDALDHSHDTRDDTRRTHGTNVRDALDATTDHSHDTRDERTRRAGRDDRLTRHTGRTYATTAHGTSTLVPKRTTTHTYSATTAHGTSTLVPKRTTTHTYASLRDDRTRGEHTRTETHDTTRRTTTLDHARPHA